LFADPGRPVAAPARPGPRRPSLGLSPDGRYLATGDDSGRLSIRDLKGGKGLRHLRDQGSPILAVSWCPKDRLLATGDSTGTIDIWDPSQGARLKPLRGRDRAVHALARPPDAPRLAVGGAEGNVGVLDMRTTGQRFCPPVRLPGSVKALAWDSKG